MKVTYDPTVFDVSSVESARKVIMPTGNAPVTTDWRWENETPWILELIEQNLGSVAGKVGLDYGCGIGRLMNPLIRLNAQMVGADISPSMLKLLSQELSWCEGKYIATLPANLFNVGEGVVDFALTVWVLQHSLDPMADLQRIFYLLKPEGYLLVVNEEIRYVPTVELSWIDDRRSVRNETDRLFNLLAEGTVPKNIVPSSAYWGLYRRKNLQAKIEDSCSVELTKEEILLLHRRLLGSTASPEEIKIINKLMPKLDLLQHLTF